MAPEVVIRKAIQADIPAITEFIEAFVESGDVLPRTFGEIEDLIETFFVAVLDDHLVGCAALEIYSWKLAEIRSLSVSSEVQGRGVGKRLVQACVDLAVEREILEVMAITRADAFFQACGFDYTLPNLKRAVFLQTRDTPTSGHQ